MSDVSGVSWRDRGDIVLTGVSGVRGVRRERRERRTWLGPAVGTGGPLQWHASSTSHHGPAGFDVAGAASGRSSVSAIEGFPHSIFSDARGVVALPPASKDIRGYLPPPPPCRGHQVLLATSSTAF